MSKRNLNLYMEKLNSWLYPPLAFTSHNFSILININFILQLFKAKLLEFCMPLFHLRVYMHVKSLQLCLTLCDPVETARFLCPWDSPGKNTGVVCRTPLQGIFLIQGSNPCLMSPALAHQFLTTGAPWEAPFHSHPISNSSAISIASIFRIDP